MQLIDHVSKAPTVYARDDAIGYGARNRPGDDAHSYVSIHRSADASGDARRHWCFRAPSRTAVGACHAAALAAGGSDGGPPGLRSQCHPAYYAAFLIDPEGNRVESFWHR